jgi:hypothetical protein
MATGFEHTVEFAETLKDTVIGIGDHNATAARRHFFWMFYGLLKKISRMKEAVLATKM